MDCNFDCDELSKYAADLPYPEVAVSEPNQRYAMLVSGIYAGKGSESTAITQYASHRFLIADYPDVYTAYKYITFGEMIHFHLLGSLIHQLGYAPLLMSYETNQYWSGSFPSYQFSLKDILQSDIEGEHGAIAHYRRLITQINDAGIQALFARIILDEEKHIEALNAFYIKYF